MFRGTVSGLEQELTQLIDCDYNDSWEQVSVILDGGGGTQTDTEVSVQRVPCRALPADGDGGTRKATAARKRFSRFPSFY